MRLGEFKVIGHRGFAGRYPENTMLSFRKALEAGADGFELDVRVTGDGHAVIHHDESTRRTTGVEKDLLRTSLAELRELDAGRGERIPTLDEVLAWARGERAIVAIELKEPEPAAAAVEAALRHGLKERVVFASFLPDVLEAPRERGFLVGFLASEEMEDSFQVARELKAAVFLPAFSILAADTGIVTRAETAGIATVPWTVNDPQKLAAVRRWGCAGVITDWPDRGAAVRDAPR